MTFDLWDVAGDDWVSRDYLRAGERELRAHVAGLDDVERLGTLARILRRHRRERARKIVLARLDELLPDEEREAPPEDVAQRPPPAGWGQRAGRSGR